MIETETRLIACTHCGAKNRIPADKIGSQAKCGKCHQALQTDAANADPEPAVIYTLRCTQCRAKNRIPSQKVNAGAKCGKCATPLQTQVLFSPAAVMVNDGNFEDTVLKSPLPVLLYCFSNSCPSCQMTNPIIDQFAADAKGKVRVGRVNVQTSPMIASRYNVLGVPFLFIFDNGALKDSMPGGIPKHEIMMKMAPYI
ncbi:MAG: thioredoxin domain-containing protein [Desulfobacterales bacterium]|nr:thioredoxin domain-containing protein [Desulfobacterales bacterium]